MMRDECLKCLPKDSGHRVREPDCVNCKRVL
jgi:hypothetical protein